MLSGLTKLASRVETRSPQMAERPQDSFSAHKLDTISSLRITDGMSSKGGLSEAKLGAIKSLLSDKGIQELDTELAKSTRFIQGNKTFADRFSKNPQIFTEESLIKKDESGRIPLHQAVMAGDKGKSTALIAAMSPQQLAMQDNDGNTPLHLAIIHNRIKLIDPLCKNMDPKDMSIKNEEDDTCLVAVATNISKFVEVKTEEGGEKTVLWVEIFNLIYNKNKEIAVSSRPEIMRKYPKLANLWSLNAVGTRQDLDNAALGLQ